MQKTDIGAYVKTAGSLVPQNSAAATLNGVAVDRLRFDSCVLQGLVGAAAGSPTATSVLFFLEESADGSTGWAAIDDASVNVGAENSSGEADVNLAGAKQFIRVSATISFTGGTSPTVDVAGLVTLGGADILPA